MINTDWGQIASIVSAIILVAGTLFALGRLAYRKWILRHQPFEIDYLYTASSSPRAQYILIALRKRTKLNAKFMCLSFGGQGEKPTIKGLYNCISGKILEDNPIPAHSIANGNWYWQNQPMLQQSNISLALAFIANKPFDGFVRVDLDCDETGRIIYDVPFKITEVKETYSGKASKHAFGEMEQIKVV
jgi:hypothetical protein